MFRVRTVLCLLTVMLILTFFPWNYAAADTEEELVVEAACMTDLESAAELPLDDYTWMEEDWEIETPADMDEIGENEGLFSEENAFPLSAESEDGYELTGVFSEKETASLMMAGNYSVPSVTEETIRIIVRITKPDGELTSVRVGVLDEEDSLHGEMILSDQNSWTESWETDITGRTYHIEVLSAQGSGGTALNWEWSAEESDSNTQTAPAEQKWVEETDLAPGYAYIFRFEENGQPCLLSVSSRREGKYGIYYYSLLPSTDSESPSDSCIWTVNNYYVPPYLIISNHMVDGVLSAEQTNNVIFAAVQNEEKYCGFDGSSLYAPLNGAVYYLKRSGSGFSAETNAAAGTVFTPCRLESISTRKTETQVELHYQKPEVTSYDILVRLIIDGNIADYEKKFGFIVSINGIQNGLYTLGNNESFTISGIPAGANLTIREKEPDNYSVSSIYMGDYSGEEYVISSVSDSGEIVFLNRLQGEIQTGISLDSAPNLLLLLLTLVLFPIWVKKQIYINNLEEMK